MDEAKSSRLAGIGDIVPSFYPCLWAPKRGGLGGYRGGERGRLMLDSAKVEIRHIPKGGYRVRPGNACLVRSGHRLDRRHREARVYYS
jgi:hypothetical protein